MAKDSGARADTERSKYEAILLERSANVDRREHGHLHWRFILAQNEDMGI